MRRRSPQRREIEGERIGCVQRELRRGESLAQARGEIAVDLDRRHMSGAGDQLVGQRGEPGADLDDVVAGLRIDCGDDPLDVARVGEEVLAKALARPMVMHDRSFAQPPPRRMTFHCGVSTRASGRSAS